MASFFVLWAASVVGLFLVLPYALTMIPVNIIYKLPPLYILIPLQAAQGAIFLGLLILAGLFFSSRTGMNLPIIQAWLDGGSVWIPLKRILVRKQLAEALADEFQGRGLGYASLFLDLLN